MDLMNKLNKAINKATEKAGELTEQAKYKVDEQKLKNQIQTKYKQMGEKLYFSRKEAFGEDEILKALDGYVEEVDLLMDALKQLNEELLNTTKQEEPVDEVEDVASLVCPACGADLNEEAAFCAQCGKRVEE